MGWFKDSESLLLQRKSIEQGYAITSSLTSIERLLGRIMAKLDNAIAAVESQTTVIESVVTLLTTLSQQLKDAKDDPVQMNDLIAKIDKNRTALADAVVANTPSAE